MSSFGLDTFEKLPIIVPKQKGRKTIKAVNQRTRASPAPIAEFNFLKRTREPANMVSISPIALENLGAPAYGWPNVNLDRRALLAVLGRGKMLSNPGD